MNNICTHSQGNFSYQEILEANLSSWDILTILKATMEVRDLYKAELSKALELKHTTDSSRLALDLASASLVLHMLGFERNGVSESGQAIWVTKPGYYAELVKMHQRLDTLQASEDALATLQRSVNLIKDILAVDAPQRTVGVSPAAAKVSEYESYWHSVNGKAVAADPRNGSMY